MGKFISKETVPIYEFEDRPVDDPSQNVIIIKARMNGRDEANYKDSLMKMNLTGAGVLSGLQPAMSTARLLLLTYNVVGWRGPDYNSVPFSPRLIEEDVDLSDPHWDRVLREIEQRNFVGNRLPKNTPTPFTVAGSEPSEAPTKGTVVSMTSKSSSRKGTTGHPNK